MKNINKLSKVSFVPIRDFQNFSKFLLEKSQIYESSPLILPFFKLSMLLRQSQVDSRILKYFLLNSAF
jgi:hypothetical protein